MIVKFKSCSKLQHSKDQSRFARTDHSQVYSALGTKH